MALFLFGLYLFLAVFAAGNMVTLQLQHYGIYPWVGKDSFAAYMQANNRAALLPSVVPALLLLLVSALLVFVRPPFMPLLAAAASLALNLGAFLSTAMWQRKIQTQLALSGYEEAAVQRLLSTNWLRTALFVGQAGLAVAVTLRALAGWRHDFY